jgi:ribosomal protein L22
MPTDILAKGRFVPISAQKVRLVVDLIRGKDVVEALSLLKFTTNLLTLYQKYSPLLWRMVKKISGSAGMICIFIAYLPMRPPRVNGVGLALEGGSNPGYGVQRM